MRYIISVAYAHIYYSNGESVITVIKLPYHKDISQLKFTELYNLQLLQGYNVPSHWAAGQHVQAIWVASISNVFGNEEEIQLAVRNQLKEFAFKCGLPAFFTFNLDLNQQDSDNYETFKKYNKEEYAEKQNSKVK